MKKILPCIFFSVMVNLVFAQTDSLTGSTYRPFRLELEPTSFIAKGWSVFGSYGITKDRNLHIGLYTLASTLPSGLNERMFHNVTSEDVIRLTFEIAGSVRYKISYNMKGESNPYVGLFFGWETFKHTSNDTQAETKLSNYFLTPQIGYEIYIFRQMIYLNPGIRVVYEFGKKSDYEIPLGETNTGPEISNWLWLPSLSLGIRL